MASSSTSWDCFWESTQIGYMEWHDGIGYDLDALRAMTDAERAETIRVLRTRLQGWREVEVYGVVNTAEARAALRDALRSASAETRLHAAAKLHDLGEPIALDQFVAKELPSITVLDGMTVALRLATRVPTPEVRRALLDGIRHRPDVAFHFAATLCRLARDVHLSVPGGDIRRFLLRLAAPHSPKDRSAAFEELCRVLGIRAE
ncbi:MAG TPA: hypothetical protein VK841_20970 [Polyangiaceae bacterium]|nr:hypothetical protein [Polyangiaceae bacterium]